MVLPPIVISPSLSLSQLRAQDKLALVAHLQTPEIAESTLRIPFPYSETDATAWIGIANTRNRQYGRTLVWAIREASGQLIGCIGFELDPASDHKAELGYWLAKPYWGQGLMTKVVKRVAEIGLETYGWARVSASVFDFNTPSAKVLEKCGFMLEASLRKFYFKNGRYFDAKIYALTR